MRFYSKTSETTATSEKPTFIERSSSVLSKPLEMSYNTSGLIHAVLTNGIHASLKRRSTRCTSGIEMPLNATYSSQKFQSLQPKTHITRVYGKTAFKQTNGSNEDGHFKSLLPHDLLSFFLQRDISQAIRSLQGAYLLRSLESLARLYKTIRLRLSVELSVQHGPNIGERLSQKTVLITSSAFLTFTCQPRMVRANNVRERGSSLSQTRMALPHP